MKEVIGPGEIAKLSFYALQLLDNATLYSKEEVIKEYETNKNAKNLEERLHNKSIYPNGEKLGFYNISKYTLNDILDKKDLYDESLKILREEYENSISKKFVIMSDLYKEMDFKDYLREHSNEEYEKYMILERKLEEEFSEYFKGFDKEVQQLFYILTKNPDVLINLLKKNINKTTKKHIDNKESITNLIINYLKYIDLDERYIDYNNLNDFLIKILFEDIKINEKISILHINPENPFIFSCLNYIKSKNSECEVKLYAILRGNHIAFVLKLLAFINKIDFNYVIREYDDSGWNVENREDYRKFFEEYDNFDFIIQSDVLLSKLGNMGRSHDLSNYDLKVSSRILYFSDFHFIGFKPNWIKNDLLESYILIPYKNTIRNYKIETFELTLLTVINYNKPIQRKNNFLAIDKNKNYDMTSKELSLEEYQNWVKSTNLYEDSYKIFSKFSNSDFSKLFSIEDYLENYINAQNRINSSNHEGKVNNEIFLNSGNFDFNEDMYDVKMKSQKKYFEIEYFEGKNRIKENLNYPIEKLGDLIIDRADAKKLGFELENDVDYLYCSDENKWENQCIFYDFEIGDKSSYHIFELVSDKLSLEYLYHYLNSELAKNEYNYFSRGHKKRVSINQIRVPIPPKEIQEKIVAAMDKRDDFLNDVQLLKNITNKNFFDYERNMNAIDEFYGKINYSAETQDLDVPDNWAYTYSGLIWPLAVTYLIASGGYSKTEKYNNLIRLLEFTVAFNSYVLMSGLPEEIYVEEKSNIWSIAYTNPNRKDKLKNKLPLGFGNWAFFHGTLAGIYKKDFYTEIDKDFYMELLDKGIRKTYDDLADERNDYFHGSIKNEEECGTLLNQLNPTKLKIFNYLNSCYKNYKLYYVVKKPELYEINDGIMTFEYTMMYLNGPYSMPIYANVLSEEILDIESLYLHDIVENKFTKIDDRLIKFKALDENKRDWRLYVFIGFEKYEGKKQAKYRCYQRPEDDIYENINLNELM